MLLPSTAYVVATLNRFFFFMRYIVYQDLQCEVLSFLLLSPQKKSEIVSCLPKRRENAICVYTELSVYVSFESQNKDIIIIILKNLCACTF